MTRVRSWRWNRGHNALVADVELGGGTYEVRFPVASVARDYVQILGDCGCSVGECEEVGFVDVISGGESVDGFLSKVRRMAKRAVTQSIAPSAIPFEPAFVRRRRQQLMGRSLRQLEQRYTRTAQRVVQQAQQQGMRAARSKQLGAGLGLAAVAFPAVGGPALAAYTIANRYAAYYDQGKAAQAALRAGRAVPGARALMTRGQAAQQKFRALRALQHDPNAQLLLQALRQLG